NNGALVYGGSDLTVVRGDFNALLAATASGPLHDAVTQALAYDEAARTCYPGFFASRINYDVVQGLNASGQWCSGVLEQSWRIGGASPAEIAALEAFQTDEQLHSIRVSSHEVHRHITCPPHARVHFRGVDPDTGPITKYSTIDAYEYSTSPA
ncbi:MAG TPA: DUF3182 family protein, partial [Dongiaceae bacterium]|nr:DUF3182 family protein [Dongiaceae bacterium]